MGTPSGGASRITAGGSSGASWSSSAGAGVISSMGAGSGGASAPSTPPGSAPPAWASCCHPCRKIDALGIQSQPSTTKGAHPSLHPSIHPSIPHPYPGVLTVSNRVTLMEQGLTATLLLSPQGGASG